MIKKLINNFLGKKRIILIHYKSPERVRIFDLIKKIKKEKETLLANIECFQLFTIVKATEKVEGNIAEVGCYKGGSSKIICEAKGDKEFHIFDTFNGLPGLSSKDNSKQFYEGQYSSEMKKVMDYLKEYGGLKFHRGIFPLTSLLVRNKVFSFVHLDLDLHDSTLDALNFFYPRMNKGGIIFAHDYGSIKGVKEAFDNFFKDKPEPIIEMSGSQCLIVKL